MGVTAKELVAKDENKRVKAAARELARDVLEEVDGDRDETADERRERLERAAHASAQGGREVLLAWALADELADVKLPDARAVIRDGALYVAGDRALPEMPR